MTPLLLLVGLLIGCQSPSASTGVSPPSGAAISVTNTLQESDVIQITFEGATNLNTTVKIPLDGMVLLPFVGRVKVAGKTPLDLETDLNSLYATQIKSSKIGVMVVSSAAAVYVSGAVLRPGKIPLDRQLTVLDAVMEAGGVDHNRAKLSSVSVLRIEDGKQRIYHFNLKRALTGSEPLLFYLKPFDTIYVPEKTFTF
ncbi:MAG: polysaccharide biosynthesis/export family protein [Opitutaceae bacterium]|nr:polysaccharide biosynthesis/export family protein [Verrucomicrobiales bacterium]